MWCSWQHFVVKWWWLQFYISPSSFLQLVSSYGRFLGTCCWLRTNPVEIGLCVQMGSCRNSNYFFFTHTLSQPTYYYCPQLCLIHLDKVTVNVFHQTWFSFHSQLTNIRNDGHSIYLTLFLVGSPLIVYMIVELMRGCVFGSNKHWALNPPGH